MKSQNILKLGSLIIIIIFAFLCSYLTVFTFLKFTTPVAQIMPPTATYVIVDSKRPESPLLEATAMPLPQPSMIPLESEAPDEHPEESDALPDLEILSHSTYVDERGRHHIVGEIRNNANAPAEYVEVIAKYYDGNQLKGANLTFTDPDAIAPGQVVPFDIVILRREHWANNHDYELIVKGYPTEDIIHQEIVVLNQNSRLTEGFLYVSGQVENTGVDWHLVKAVVTLYDANNKVINSKWDYIEKAMIAPGAVASFEVKLEHQTNPENYHYRVHLEADKVSPPGIVDVTPTPLDRP
jgi:hypothetical protein